MVPTSAMLVVELRPLLTLKPTYFMNCGLLSFSPNAVDNILIRNSIICGEPTVTAWFQAGAALAS